MIIWVSTFICQILIVQYGGAWFSTAQLTWTQWAVCLAFGVSELLFGQIVAIIPSKKLPKSMGILRGDAIPTTIAFNRRQDPNQQQHQLAMSQSARSYGHSLWLRGVNLVGIHVSFTNTIVNANAFSTKLCVQCVKTAKKKEWELRLRNCRQKQRNVCEQVIDVIVTKSIKKNVSHSKFMFEPTHVAKLNKFFRDGTPKKH